MRSTIIGVGHYSRVGKDSFANELVKQLRRLKVPARKRSFAWKLKDICHQLYAWDGMREPEFYETEEGEPFRNIPLPTVGKTPVQIWIDMGTPAVRENVYQGTWIQYIMQNLEPGVTVVPDVRFYNEVNAIRGFGGRLIKIIRPGFPPRQSVADRTLLDYEDWDLILGQSGKMDDLHNSAVLIAGCLADPKQDFPVQDIHAKRAALAIEQKTLGDAGIAV